MERKQRRSDKWVLIVALICLITGSICLLSAGIYWTKGYLTKRDNTSRAEQFHAGLSASVEATGDAERADPAPEDPAEDAAVLARIREQIATLQEINPDVIGWITVEGTPIDYPVVRTDDNKKYLTTNLEGKRDAHGAVFMDSRGSLQKINEQWILYGHNMKDGTMFAPLEAFKDPKYIADHRTITFYTADGRYTFEIDAVYVWDGQDDGTYDIRSESGDTEILLSTCDANNKRLVVHGVLTEEVL